MCIAIGAAKIKRIELSFGDSRRKNDYCAKPMLALSKLRLASPAKPYFLPLAGLRSDVLKAAIESGAAHPGVQRCRLAWPGFGAPAGESAKTPSDCGKSARADRHR
jgi:hypothetical protein